MTRALPLPARQVTALGRFENLRPNTQRNHRLMLESVCATGANLKFAMLTAADVKVGLMSRESRPRMAQSYVSVMRALFAFAKDSDFIASNPADAALSEKQP